MKRRLLILAAVVTAVAAVLWLKSEVKQEPSVAPAAPPASAKQGSMATVLLFSDPREAEESCGCAEIIRMVRDLRDVPGVLVREIDSRNPGDAARRHGVRTSPAVLILDAAGNERARFEGESSATIASLRSALAELQRSSGRASETTAP